MKTVIVSLVAAFTLSALVVAPSVMTQQPNTSAESPSGEAKKDDEGKKAIREFMQSPKAPQAMNNMMEMARRMGHSDPMLGMTKMMEMMGGQGGMGGSGSMGQGGMMGDRSRGSK